MSTNIRVLTDDALAPRVPLLVHKGVSILRIVRIENVREMKEVLQRMWFLRHGSAVGPAG